MLNLKNIITQKLFKKFTRGCYTIFPHFFFSFFFVCSFIITVSKIFNYVKTNLKRMQLTPQWIIRGLFSHKNFNICRRKKSHSDEILCGLINSVSSRKRYLFMKVLFRSSLLLILSLQLFSVPFVNNVCCTAGNSTHFAKNKQDLPNT